MDDLIAFLNARISDDERVALPVSSGGNWNIAIHGDPGWGIEGDQYMVEHIVRHDPARVLADVAAQRAIVELHYIIERKVSWVDADGDEWQNHQPVCVLCVEKYSTVDVPDDLGPCRTIRLLASVYADHPDYRQEWKP